MWTLEKWACAISIQMSVLITQSLNNYILEVRQRDGYSFYYFPPPLHPTPKEKKSDDLSNLTLSTSSFPLSEIVLFHGMASLDKFSAIHPKPRLNSSYWFLNQSRLFHSLDT